MAKTLRQPKADGGAGLKQSQVRPREVALITVISKCRVDKAVKKYTSFIATLEEYNLSLESLYESNELLIKKLKGKWCKKIMKYAARIKAVVVLCGLVRQSQIK